MRDIIVFAACIIFLSMGIFNVVISGVTYWWFAIFRPQEWIYGDSIGTLRLPLVAAGLFAGLSFLKGYFPSVKDSIAKLMLSVLALSVFAFFFSNCDPIVLKQNYMLDFSVLIIMVLFTARIIQKKKHLFAIVAIVGLSLGFHAGKAGIVGLIGGGGTFYGASNMGGLFTGSNGFAFGSAVLLFFNLYILKLAYNGQLVTLLPERLKSLSVIRVFKYIMPIIVAGTAYNVVSLSSRGSFLAMAVGVSIWLWLNGVNFRVMLVIALVSVSSLLFVELPEGFAERIESAFADKNELEHSAASRPHFWGVAIDIANDHPTGVGPGCYNSHYNAYDSSGGKYGYSRTVHSSHFEVLSEVGYMGMFFWILLIFISMKRLLKIRKFGKTSSENETRFFYDAANMLIAAQFTFLIGGSFYAQAYNDIIWVIWGLTIALSKLYYSEAHAAQRGAELPQTRSA